MVLIKENLSGNFSETDSNELENRSELVCRFLKYKTIIYE